jgi:hypothetical protein
VDKRTPDVIPHVYFHAGEINVLQDSNLLQTKTVLFLGDTAFRDFN